MSFPKYGKYMKSDNELLGEIPTHWEVWKLAHAFAQIGSGTTPKSDKAEYYDDGSIPWVNTGDLDDGLLKESSKKITEKAVEDHSTLKLYPSGSLLFAMYGATIGKLGILNFPATVNQACCVFSGKSPITIKFLFYWFLGLRQKILSLATGGGQPNVSQDILRTLRVACPDDEEQTAIAIFLDAETSKIDALVTEQRRLIELLQEKRQAVISHAVTKGLTPNAPLKDSGIEWLGEVPEHWAVKRLGHLGRLQNGLNIGGEAFGSGDPFVSYGDVYNNTNVPEIPSGLVQSTQSDQAKYNLEVGDVFFTRTSETVDDIGIASTCLCSIPRATFAGFLIRFRPNRGILAPRYSTYLFRNQGVQGHFAGTMNLVTRASLSQDVLKMLPICIPPIEEQQVIAAFIYDRLELFRSLISEAERAIELLQERRTALISAAVTGKIDVREYATQETA